MVVEKMARLTKKQNEGAKVRSAVILEAHLGQYGNHCAAWGKKISVWGVNQSTGRRQKEIEAHASTTRWCEPQRRRR